MSPWKSEAQRKKFYELLKEGKISQETIDEYERSTNRKRLPPRVKKQQPVRIRSAKVIK